MLCFIQAHRRQTTCDYPHCGPKLRERLAALLSILKLECRRYAMHPEHAACVTIVIAVAEPRLLVPLIEVREAPILGHLERMAGKRIASKRR